MNKLIKSFALFIATLTLSTSLFAASATQTITIHVDEIYASEIVDVKKERSGSTVTYTLEANYVSNTDKELALEHEGMDVRHLKAIKGHGSDTFTVEYHFSSEEQAMDSEASDLRLVIR